MNLRGHSSGNVTDGLNAAYEIGNKHMTGHNIRQLLSMLLTMKLARFQQHKYGEKNLTNPISIFFTDNLSIDPLTYNLKS